MNDSWQPWKILSETVCVGVLTEGWTLAEVVMDGLGEQRTFTYPILFATPFSSVPVVTLGLTGFDLDQHQSSRIDLLPVAITQQGFKIQIATWRDTQVYSVAFSWLAVGA
jgi:hypothetical protein